jgi:hypothetical protein
MSNVDVLKINIREDIIVGGFRNLNLQNSKTTTLIPSWKLMVFISSTFTDTQDERDILLNKILPKLSMDAERFQIQVIFVDMRWGIKDENTLDHKTWIECERFDLILYLTSNCIFY